MTDATTNAAHKKTVVSNISFNNIPILPINAQKIKDHSNITYKSILSENMIVCNHTS